MQPSLKIMSTAKKVILFLFCCFSSKLEILRLRKLHQSQSDSNCQSSPPRLLIPPLPFPDRKFIHFGKIFDKTLLENLNFCTCMATRDPWLQQSPRPSPHLSPSQVEQPKTRPTGRKLEQQKDGSSRPFLPISWTLDVLMLLLCQLSGCAG